MEYKRERLELARIALEKGRLELAGNEIRPARRLRSTWPSSERP